MSYFYIDKLMVRRPNLLSIKQDIEKTCETFIHAYRNGGKVLVCGNGGSCADAGHIAGELMKGFHKQRPLPPELISAFQTINGRELAEKLQMPLRAIDLSAMTALNTAFANDVGSDYMYAQQTLAFAEAGDVFIGISTSGNAVNVHYAAITAKVKGATLVGLTGNNGGKMRESGIYDIMVNIPEEITFRIQEEHIAVYHAICLEVEDTLFV